MYIYIYMYVCKYVCMYVCMYVCIRLKTSFDLMRYQILPECLVLRSLDGVDYVMGVGTKES